MKIFALAAALLAAPALAAVDEVRLQVKGLACPFCTYGIEKHLKKLPGVLSVETTVRTGIVRIQVEPAAHLDVEGLQKAVARSGFTLDHMEATVTGRLALREGRPILKADPGDQAFLLIETSRGEASEELSPETLGRLNQASSDGARALTITGRLHSHASMPPALSVESFVLAK